MDINLHNVTDASVRLNVLDNGVHTVSIVFESAQYDDRKSYDGLALFFDTKAQFEEFKRSIIEGLEA